ncbi:transcriptional regulator domain-containing protein [Bradyrhizobium liaoningense]|uniref:transcriptional regulator domain-containing protein n=1 Tax=Bradyrhizobium liaoningense TaxID=43992 RepID=UPI0020126313|nr:hypothetical protein [Bradyrhizobium liaoningense]
MPEFDWRSPDSFKSLENAEITHIACEGLRMNVDYNDYEAMIASSPRWRSDRGFQEVVGHLLSPMIRKGPPKSRRSFGHLRF